MMKSKSSSVPGRWFRISILNFLLAALLGTLLRYAFVGEVPGLIFTHVLHAHSHTAMLGWVYLALFALLIKYFLPDDDQIYKRYNRLFWWTQSAVIGMLIAFIMQGYGVISIIFSSFHAILSYLFIIKFWKDLKKNKYLSRPSILFARTSLFFLFFSTLALWAMPIILSMGFGKGALYYGAVQYYLHFQFNGWFIFCMLAIFFKYLENNHIRILKNRAKQFYFLLVISCFLTYVLAVTWSTPIPALFAINGVGVVVQLAAIILFIWLIRPYIRDISSIIPNWLKWLIAFAFICFILKVLVQTAVVIPFIAKVGYTIRNYVIGFLHLLLLGMISSSILFFSDRVGLSQLACKRSKLGVFFFLVGFLLSEMLLITQGTMFWANLGFLPGYYEALTIISAFIPVGIALILISQFRLVKS